MLTCFWSEESNSQKNPSQMMRLFSLCMHSFSGEHTYRLFWCTHIQTVLVHTHTNCSGAHTYRLFWCTHTYRLFWCTHIQTVLVHTHIQTVLVHTHTDCLDVSVGRPPRWPSGKRRPPGDPGFESHLWRDFSEVESYQWLGTPVATLPGAWR